MPGAAAHIRVMDAKTLNRPELLCISCSGGGRDANCAYTVCALRELDAAGQAA